jgi:hypothetical protein
VRDLVKGRMEKRTFQREEMEIEKTSMSEDL